MDPLPLAEKENIHNLVKQDRKLKSDEEFTVTLTKSKQNQSDFQTISKVRHFVSKYYKDCDSNQGL